MTGSRINSLIASSMSLYSTKEKSIRKYSEKKKRNTQYIRICGMRLKQYIRGDL